MTQEGKQDKLKGLTESIEQGVKDIFQSEEYEKYLITMSRFHRYSINNQILIHTQNPEATLVAGFNKWQNQFKRNVMKGERGIKIIAPAFFNRTIEVEKVIDKDRRRDGDYYKKPTQYWFINMEPKSNFIFEPLEYVEQKRSDKVVNADGMSRKEIRSLMHPQYADRFIRRYILD